MLDHLLTHFATFNLDIDSSQYNYGFLHIPYFPAIGDSAAGHIVTSWPPHVFWTDMLCCQLCIRSLYTCTSIHMYILHCSLPSSLSTKLQLDQHFTKLELLYPKFE